ncbi:MULTISPECIES: hypothetical protein [Spirosoma]|uniref:Uncharacterized protein n=1 Tax=Spirosoma sordidisoli TaxID=2502893 RepID=A0A4Q2UNC0_9BACT|nr:MULTISPECIES: hypothetical protein [Spirosoma]RYC68289.1 hypothetical protein EQG79_18150 [Spirosoma sordidisoli]
MKKFIMAVCGLALFATGYQYTRRQAAFMAAHTNPIQATYNDVSSTTAPPEQLRNTLTFRLIKPS